MVTYSPAHFEEPGVEVMHAPMQAQPLSTPVTMISSGIDANHIPLHLFHGPESCISPRGIPPFIHK